jgi:cysteine-rich repeat protein
MERVSLGDPSTDFPGLPREAYTVHAANVVTSVATSDSAGTLRLERVGTTVNGYYRSVSSGDSWILMDSTPGVPTDQASIDLNLGPPELNTNQQVKVALDNFVVTSGQVTCKGCGDGIRDQGESCDDGNVLDGDGCSRTCSLE